MSLSQAGFSISVPTGQSFASLQYTPVQINSSGVLVSADSAANIHGIIQDNPDNSTTTVGNVMIVGLSRAVLKGSVSVGQQLQVHSSGQGLVTLDGGTAVAFAMEAGASGDTVQVLLTIANGSY